MNIVAFVFAILGAGLSIFQPIISIRTPVWNINFNVLRILSDSKLFGGSDAFQGAIEILVSAIIAIICGVCALKRSKKRFNGVISYYYDVGFLTLCALEQFIRIGIFLYDTTYMERMFASMYGAASFQSTFLLWGSCYAIAALCAYIDKKSLTNTQETPKIGYSFPEIHSTHSVSQDTPNVYASESSSKSSKKIDYEPVIGVETGALIKHALLFLEDKDLNSAGRYINQAINQDPENSQAYLIKLMVELGVYSTDELCKISSPLKDQKLFKRALSFANDEEKTILEHYLEINEKNLEAIEQAEIEKKYLSFLKMKESLNSSRNAQSLINMLEKIVPYKDSEALIQEVKQIKQKFEVIEKKYADAFSEKQAIERQSKPNIDEIHRIAGMFDALGNYKDCNYYAESLRRLASEQVEKAKNRKFIRKCLIIAGIIAIVAVCCAPIYKKFSAYMAVKNEEKSKIQNFVSMAEKNMPQSELNELVKQLNKGDSKSQNTLGEMYYNGKVIKQDYNQAFYWFSKSVEQENSDAQDNIGTMYYNGLGTKQDYEKALYYYKKSAEQNNASAQGNLGVMYYEGLGTKQDFEKALSWFTKAAEQGNVASQSWLGSMYYNGKGTKQDFEKALSWFTKSAEQGNAVAQYMLGFMYYKGVGTKQDLEKALSWFTKSAEQGNLTAQYYLGLCYESLLDFERALYWLTKAADQNNNNAQYKLGLMYEVVYRSYEQAEIWYEKALKNGNKEAEEALEKLRNKRMMNAK